VEMLLPENSKEKKKERKITKEKKVANRRRK
jgi:hypothetical protein